MGKVWSNIKKFAGKIPQALNWVHDSASKVGDIPYLGGAARAAFDGAKILVPEVGAAVQGFEDARALANAAAGIASEINKGMPRFKPPPI